MNLEDKMTKACPNENGETKILCEFDRWIGLVGTR